MARTLARLVYKHALSTPDAPALFMPTVSAGNFTMWTYGALATKSKSLASALSMRGIQR